ncbi:MAG: vitamin B12-dependent ribonucleotide reductase [Oscillospiraceae bacterium]|nr:vitamin B12-dependent ribonucleotide reductase [Oscillospiraceae bacterium]
MELTQNAITVLERRYLARGENGKLVETPEDLFRRVANAIAQPDLKYDSEAEITEVENEFYEMMTSLDFLPNSPTLMNAGRPLGQLSACFVLPVADSMEAIFEAVKQAALIHKSGGGTGFSFSRLRPTGSVVNSTGGVASGPISFMRVFNMATEAVKQGGTRRGANMGILRVDHPDILQFIDCKKDNADITNFNISVGITEAFMQAVEDGNDYDLIDPSTKLPVGQLNARQVFDKIVHSAWHNGEPGIIFLDRLNRDNVVPEQGEIESTNPCGEQPLLPYESCNLGSINLVNMLKFTDGVPSIDWDKLGATVNKAVHFLDNVIDANKYPLELIAHTTRQTRKIGLGIMGWADMLLHIRIPYNSDEAVALAHRLMEFVTSEGRRASIELAKTRGAFPLFSQSIYKDGEPLRNATITTIAPTGTLSILAGVSSGVEPVFSYVYIRNVMDETEMLEVNTILKELLVERGLYTDELMKKIAEHGTLAHIEELPEDIRTVFVSAHDISPLDHIKMQAAFQDHTDNAVSKTVNFPNNATEEEVSEVYRLSYRLGCKGVTIYRDGSRDSQVLNLVSNKDAKPAEKEQSATFSVMPRPRPDMTQGITEKMSIGCGNLYITVNYDEYGICEVFTNTGKAGGCPSQSEATARLTSVALRSGIDVKTIVSQLRGIRCPSTIRQKGMKCTSCPDAIARVIEKVVESNGFKESEVRLVNHTPKYAEEKKAPVVIAHIRECPECGEKVEHEGGCVICKNCGYSKCG